MNFIGILENVSNMLQDSDKLFLKRNTPGWNHFSALGCLMPMYLFLKSQ